MKLGFNGHDVTSGFPIVTSGLTDDVVTISGDQMTDHGQMGTSGFLMTSRHVIVPPVYRTDIGVITPTLTVEC